MTDESFIPSPGLLKVSDHSRAFSAMTYVYPVVSRRAQGVSIGINLSPNNACNWRCRYCQVPDLKRGTSPALNFPLFKSELERLTDAICNGTFLEYHAPPEARTLKDFAFSGNGEPTSCPDFPAAVRHVGEVRSRFGLAKRVALVLITNGSLVNQATVREGLQVLSEHGGEVWFKLDRGSDSALASANGTSISLTKQLSRLRRTSELCRTRIQTCWYTTDSQDPSPTEVDEYVACLEHAIGLGVRLASVQLYTLARKPLLPDGAVLGEVSASWLSDLGARLAKLGLIVDL